MILTKKSISAYHRKRILKIKRVNVGIAILIAAGLGYFILQSQEEQSIWNGFLFIILFILLVPIYIMWWKIRYRVYYPFVQKKKFKIPLVFVILSAIFLYVIIWLFVNIF